MNRRAFLALLPLPWVSRWLPAPRPVVVDATGVVGGIIEPVKQVGVTTFVCRKPEGMMLLRENMRIDIYDAPPWWRRLWNRLWPPEPEPEPSVQRITTVDYDTRTITCGP